MEENNNGLIEPYNPTDPIVKMDPEKEKTHIARSYMNTDTSDEEAPYLSNTSAQTRYDAIIVPLVQINQTQILDAQIISVEVSISGFLPTLYLKIEDTNGAISKLNSPGMSSTVTVIMAPPIEGVSKSVSLDFYITSSVSNPDGTIEIYGEYNVPLLDQEVNMQIGNGKLTTYEFLKRIAQDTKLGFAATEKCEDVDDSRWRQVYAQTFKDYIEDQLSFAGKGNESVFDAWVDQFGYLVMVNLPYVMGEKVEHNQLMMRIVKGMAFNEKKDVVSEQKYEETIRMITNARDLPSDTNAKFVQWSEELNNETIKDEGTSNKYYYMSGIGDTNTISMEELELVEPSVDGQKNKDIYKFDKCEFIGFEMDEDAPILVQKRIVSRFKAAMNYKQIFVEMENPNYFLQRGTLINVDFEDYDMATKKVTALNNGNIDAASSSDDITVSESGNNAESIGSIQDALLNEQMSFTNYGLSGMYYINDIEYKYDKAFEGIIQCMHLVKRGSRNNLINDATPLNTF